MTVAVGVVLGVQAPSASATSGHLFDASLSLRGMCAASKTDPVADPGCPYPTPGEGGPRAFENPCGAAVDRYGDLYVVSSAEGKENQGEGWIDVFDAAGDYLTRIDPPGQGNPCSVAVDSKGTLYLSLISADQVVSYSPEAFPPVAGTAYGSPTVVETGCGVPTCSVAVDPSNDHLYVARATRIRERNSASDGNEVVNESWGVGVATDMEDVDVCGKTHDVYVTGIPADVPLNEAVEMPRVFIFDGSDGHTKAEISGTGEEEFGYVFGNAGIAVDQLNCDFYVDDVQAHQVVDQFATNDSLPGGVEFIGKLPKPPTFKEVFPFAGLAVDDPMETGEASYHSPNAGYVYVTSGKRANEEPHLFAFRPREIGPPLIKAQEAAEITETEAVLQAQLQPNGLPTSYHFEYTTEADFEANGYANAMSVPVPPADGGEGGAFHTVSAAISGLSPGTRYRARLVATNEECTTVGEGEGCQQGLDIGFATYPPPLISGACPNASLRIGASAGLPECRAYELVTPPDTNGRTPTMTEFGGSIYGVAIETQPVSENGDSLVFGTEGGALPDLPGGGYHDAYEARRDPTSGWHSDFAGMTGAQASAPIPGGFAANHGYSFWEARGSGSFAGFTEAGLGSHYIHRPGGVIDPNCSPEPTSGFEWIGCGSLGHNLIAYGKLISPDGGHVVFASIAGEKKQLEPCAAPTGTTAIYDRTSDGVTHCISVKPDGTPFAAGEDASYLGSSADGTVVAFEVGKTMYATIDDTATVEVASGGVVFGGLSQHGDRLFFMQRNNAEPLLKGTEIPQGEIFACDVRLGPCAGAQKTQEATQIGSGEESVLVNVSADGSKAYFVSPKQLDGAKGVVGGSNLYDWDGSTVKFIATLDPADVSGEPAFSGSESRAGGLGLWITHAVAAERQSANGPAADPSRTTSDGRFFVFESRANLTGYPSGGHREIYRYDAGSESLACISCNPTGLVATADAKLESNIAQPLTSSLPPVNELTQIPNVVIGGQRIFFESRERLVPADVDGKVDVYEWIAEGTDGCDRTAGCLALISSGNSAGNEYLYAMTPDGHDVFLESFDLLTSQDLDGTPSIYDARVGGGFPQANAPACQGDACQGGPAIPPSLPHPGSDEISPVTGINRVCPKGKRRMRGKNGSRCVAKHKKQGRHKGSKKRRRGGSAVR